MPSFGCLLHDCREASPARGVDDGEVARGHKRDGAGFAASNRAPTIGADAFVMVTAHTASART
jgi:hypothetical protein